MSLHRALRTARLEGDTAKGEPGNAEVKGLCKLRKQSIYETEIRFDDTTCYQCRAHKLPALATRSDRK